MSDVVEIDDETLAEACDRLLKKIIGEHDYDLMVKQRGQDWVNRVAMGNKNLVIHMINVVADMGLTFD